MGEDTGGLEVEDWSGVAVPGWELFVMNNLVRVWMLDREGPSVEAVLLLLTAYGLLEEADMCESRLLRTSFSRIQWLEAIGYSIPARVSALCRVPGGEAELSRDLNEQSLHLQDLMAGIMFEFPLPDGS